MNAIYCYRHGDVVLLPSTKQPDLLALEVHKRSNTVLAQGSNGGRHMLKGHHQVVDLEEEEVSGARQTMGALGFPEEAEVLDTITKLVICCEECTVSHSRGDHATKTLPAGAYFVVPQQEWHQPRVID